MKIQSYQTTSFVSFHTWALHDHLDMQNHANFWLDMLVQLLEVTNMNVQ